ncbi:MAG: sigma factor-like helix-turn-helix DNA-binding protein [Candidatus Pacebacteria bacterium]|nr:sigma factor-like helix-turn-helix DNA-binding protein [Candidatus Paceibacterota bacterium]
MTEATTKLSFKPKQISKKLLSSLNPRMRDIVSNRYGLDSEKRMTLEAIGKNYNITRERVRQIENFALTSIKKTPEYKESAFIFDELKEIIQKLGSVVTEDTLMTYITKDKVIQNHINLYLVLGGYFTKGKETDNFYPYWSVDDILCDHVKGCLCQLHDSIDEDQLLQEEEVLEKFVSNLDQLVDEYKNNREIINKYLSISKVVGKNELGEWGKVTSPHIKARGVKDYAYLVVRKNGKPMHFRDVATEIEKTFKKKTNVATCHNELIKDKRFVLVGRGMYGLKEWGHAAGVVRDVIIQSLKESGKPMLKQEIVDRVLEKRIVKANTVVINLQDAKYFRKDKDGRYYLIK